MSVLLLRRSLFAVAATVSVSGALLACGGSDDPGAAAPTTVAVDPARSAEGERVYLASCSSCHGKSGEGARGPNISGGRVADEYPDVAEVVALVTGGRGEMPAFGPKLSEAEIDAVAHYVRDEL